MLYDRGFAISEASLKGDLDSFKDEFGPNPSRDQIFVYASHKTNSNDVIFVFFLEEKKPRIKSIRDCFQKMQEGNVRRAIFVVQETPSPKAVAVLEEIGLRFRLEHFMESELLINVTHHVFLYII
jgi:DNA-directed RNA polymerase I, II, and III subunit RPABC1